MRKRIYLNKTKYEALELFKLVLFSETDVSNTRWLAHFLVVLTIRERKKIRKVIFQAIRKINRIYYHENPTSKM